VINQDHTSKQGVLFGIKRRLPTRLDALVLVTNLRRRKYLDKDMFRAFDILGQRGPKKGVIQCVQGSTVVCDCAGH
jgi:hypothetical protein